MDPNSAFYTAGIEDIVAGEHAVHGIQQSDIISVTPEGEIVLPSASLPAETDQGVGNDILTNCFKEDDQQVVPPDPKTLFEQFGLHEVADPTPSVPQTVIVHEIEE